MFRECSRDSKALHTVKDTHLHLLFQKEAWETLNEHSKALRRNKQMDIIRTIVRASWISLLGEGYVLSNGRKAVGNLGLFVVYRLQLA